MIKHLGLAPYLQTYQAMQDFTAVRTLETPDELWICEHLPVFTQGLASRSDHLLATGNIPVVSTNRGGQVTFHGPGQVVAYPLINLQRAGYYVKEYVYRIEEAVIRTLDHFGLTGHRVSGAPGIYIRLDAPRSHSALMQHKHAPKGASKNPNFAGLGKIAALGIKISRHCTYHGLAFNVAMDLSPYQRINPCGYQGLQTIDLSTIGVSVSWQEAADVLSQKLIAHLTP